MKIDYLVDYRPPRIAMSFALIAVVVHLLMPLTLHPSLPAAASITGLVGFALMIRAWWLFKVAGTAICPTESSTSLVTHDVFSISRNPMYLGIVLMLTSVALHMGTMPFYAAVIGFGVVMNVVFCPYEERKALAEFGDKYETYADRVRRWL